jgi:signal transduction histidine kinase/CheY-like chemotaxis protein
MPGPHRFTRLFASGPTGPLSFEALERLIQQRMFAAMAGLIGLATAVYGGIYAVQRKAGLAWLCAVACTVTLGCAAWAARTRRFVGPLRTVGLVMLALLCWVTLQQGEGLPAAGWWLSVIPFMMAGAGLHYLAIGCVVAFVAVVSVLHFGPPAAVPGLVPELGVEPWRRYAAVVGSELLALTLIILTMRWRVEVARALDDARTATRDAMEVKARFLANISHEIRTPLNGIIGASDLLDSPRLSSDQRLQLLGLQRQSARTLLALVNDVLDVAKLEAGKVTLEIQPLFLRGVVFEANELFSVQAHGKGIELSSSCNPDVPQSFLGDPVRLRQIVNNLVGNAVKFTAEGGVHIHLSMDDAEAPQRDTERWVRIEIVDSGIGISEAQLGRLFAPFTQADTSTTRRFGGTGLGLSISQELARLMGGRIEVRSTVAVGSSFALVLPLPVQGQALTWQPPSRRSDVLLVTANRGLERHVKSLLFELNVEPVCLAGLPADAGLDGCRLLLVDAPLLRMPDVPAWLAGHAAAGRQVAILTPLGADTVVGAPHGALMVYKPVRRKSLQAVLDAIDPGGARGADAAERDGPLTGLHVLVADDNPVNQVVVQAMLAELGATSVVVNDGREALACALEDRFDLVLMDMHMPRLDGLAATAALRREEVLGTKTRLPVVAMTANCEADEGAACARAGMDGFLSKPFGLTELRRCLDRVPRAGTTDRRVGAPKG